MRLAIGRISDGELDFAKNICSFVRDIYRELALVVPHMDDNSDMKMKMDTMLQSVMKIENGITQNVHLSYILSMTYFIYALKVRNTLIGMFLASSDRNL